MIRHLLFRSLSLTLYFVPALAVAAQICDGDNETTPVDNFTISDVNSAYVVDNSTGLAWYRCVLGQNWDELQSTCVGEAIRLSWQDALQSTTEFTLMDKHDWRLPNIKELVSIVERECVSPAINQDLFPNTPSDSYWTSSPNTNSSLIDESWSVAFYNGRIESRDKMQDFYVRMVRYAE